MTTAAPEDARRFRRLMLPIAPGWRLRVYAGAIIAVLVSVSLAISAKAGAVPQNDDWSYVRSAFELHDNGTLHLQGWGQMFLLGQLVTAQPFLWVFGDRTAGLDAYGALAVIVWLSCAYWIGRRATGDGRAVLLVLGIAAWPGMPLLTSSFMTDAPSAAASLLCVVAGIVAIRRQSRLFGAAWLLAGLFAFTIREQFVVGVAAVVLAAWVTRGVTRRFRVELTAGAAVLAGVCAVLEHLRHQMTNADVPPFGFSTLDFHRFPPSLVPCLFTVGLAVSPLAIWNLLTLRARDLLDPGRLVGWVLGLLAIGTVAKWDFAQLPNVTLTNYVTRLGGFWDAVVGESPAIMGMGMWRTLEVLAMLGGVAIVGELGARAFRFPAVWRSWRDGYTAALTMTVYTALLLLFTIGLGFAGQQQFDRYLIALFPGAGMLLLRPMPARGDSARVGWPRKVATSLSITAVVGFLAAAALVITVSSDVRDAGVWHVAAKLAKGGVPPTELNAGLDWDGMHATTNPARKKASELQQLYQGQHWSQVFPGSRDCYVVSVTPRRGPGFHLLGHTRRGPYGTDRRRLDFYSYRYDGCGTTHDLLADVPSGPH